MLKEIHHLGYSLNILYEHSVPDLSKSEAHHTHEHHQTLNLISVQCTGTKITHKKFHTHGTNWREHQGWCLLSLGTKRNTGEAGNFSPRCYRGNNNRKQNSRKKNKCLFRTQRWKSVMEKLSLSSFPSYTTESEAQDWLWVLWMRRYFHWMDLSVKYHLKTFQNLLQMTDSSQNKSTIVSHLCESNWRKNNLWELSLV